MNAKRFNMVLIALLFLLIAGGVGVTAYASIWLKKRSENIVTLKLDTSYLEAQRTNAQKAKAELEEYSDTKTIIDKIIPKGKDQAKAVAELLKISSDNGLTISSITFPSSDLGVAQQKTAAPASGSSTDTSAAPAPATPSVSQAKPVDGLSGILGIDVTVSQILAKNRPAENGISYDQLLNFLRGIEKNRRTMQIKTMQILPIKDKTGDRVVGYNLNLTISIFVKP